MTQIAAVPSVLPAHDVVQKSTNSPDDNSGSPQYFKDEKLSDQKLEKETVVVEGLFVAERTTPRRPLKHMNLLSQR